MDKATGVGPFAKVKVRVNTCSKNELYQLPGVGNQIAGRIMELRDQGLVFDKELFSNACSSPRALGPVEEQVSHDEPTPPPDGQVQEPAESSRTVVVSKNRLRQCPVCGLVTREKNTTPCAKDSFALVLVWDDCLLGLWPTGDTGFYISSAPYHPT